MIYVQVCSINSTDNPYIEETIEDKIAQLKADGINYDEDLMQKLLTIVNLKNSLSIDLTLKPNKLYSITNRYFTMKLKHSMMTIGKSYNFSTIYYKFFKSS